MKEPATEKNQQEKKKNGEIPDISLKGISPWMLDPAEALEKFGSDRDKGLVEDQAQKRLEQYGANRIRAKQKRSAIDVLVDQLKNLIVLLLFVAAAVSFIFGQMLEGVSILAAMLINVVIGFGTELRAVRAMESLKEMTRVRAKVLRGGEVREIVATGLVPGDIVIMEAGDMVSADLRLIESNRVQADESSLTGESVSVDKEVDVLPEDTPLAERTNMLFKGTVLTQGSAKGLVVSTGMSTEIGHISELTEAAEKEEATPLEKRLNQLGQRLIWLTLAIAALVGLTGFIGGQDVFLIFETSIALAVAAIPEGLPIVATIALARGMWRMVKKNALVNRLSSVETLGATSIIFTDKTGTLTENKMTLTQLAIPSSDGVKYIDVNANADPPFLNQSEEALDSPLQKSVEEILTCGVLCNNAELGEDGGGVGDPLEVALLTAGRMLGLERRDMLKSLPEKKEVAFSDETKMMGTWHGDGDQFLLAVKGAPEAVIDACTKSMKGTGEEVNLNQEDRERLLKANEDMAAQGLRVLSVARRHTSTIKEDPYSSLIFLGLVGLLDPPREGVKDVIDDLHGAGIRVVMVTGDQSMTAHYVGKALGLNREDEPVIQGKELSDPGELSSGERRRLLKSSIFARISPEQKLNIISLFQSEGLVVAMTGDGVNDAPALTKADIGVAMGKRGTQVAREASDIVLKDDAFSTIALAVEQGRVIFNNIRKFIVFLLSGNIGTILIVGTAMLFGDTLPLLPLQILYLNMISDVFPALALGAAEGDHSVMESPPRPRSEPVVPGSLWVMIGAYGVLLAATVLTGFWVAMEAMSLPPEQAVTVSFLTLAFTRTWHVFNMRDFGSNLFSNDVTRNPFVWGAVALSVGLLLLAVYFPPLANVLSMVTPSSGEWLLILGISLVPLGVVQVAKQFSFLNPLRRENEK
ncbi:MAG: cation-transporting P-type ATPase [Desulfatiglandaceae bacterium]